MNAPFPFVRRTLLAAALLLTAPTLLRAADPAPTVAKTASDTPVTVADKADEYILANGVVAAHIDKRSGNLNALLFRGAEVTGHDQGRPGVWEQDPSAAAQAGGLTQSVTIDPAKNGGERGEVSIKGVTGGKVGLTPGSPGAPATGTFNMDLELRYAMGRGESGVYTYAIFSHPAAYGPLSVPESRFITKLNQAFDWISVDADRNMLECKPTDWGTGIQIHAKEQRIMSVGVYKNSVEHKYSYNVVQYKAPAYGWSSTKEHVGVWFINPTIEYLSGGASKQELVCHFGDNGNPDPIILNYWRGTHYGGGASANVAAGEEWNKVVGPMMIYVNALAEFKTPSAADLSTLEATAGNPTVPAAWKENATALWQDALRQAKAEKANWPLAWVSGVDYPHKGERGAVTGQIVLNDPQAPTKKLPHLTVGLAYSYPLAPTETLTASAPAATAAASPGVSPGAAPSRGRFFGGASQMDWKHDAKHYQFWNDGAEDGAFTITNVRPGDYTLHAFADGVLGEFAHAGVTVKAGETLDLGKIEWHPARDGKQLWEIGYPNRDASEFFKGDGDNYWLWGWPLRYALLFPNDLTYTVGKSDWRKDWFFEQVPHALSTAWLNPDAKDPANQRFGWVKVQGADTWRDIGRGRATTWTIKFPQDKAGQGTATLRLALAGADGAGGLAVNVNGKEVGVIHPMATNAIRYNTDKGVWQEQKLAFDAALLKPGENEMQLTVPAGDVTTGVVYDYLRLEMDEDRRFEHAAATATAATAATSAETH